MIGMGFLKQNLRITADDLRNAMLLGPINGYNVMATATNNRIGLIEQLEREITLTMYNAEGITNDDSNNRRRSRNQSRSQQQRVRSRSRSQLRSHLSEQYGVIVIPSDSETETESETESEPVSAGYPRSVRDRLRRTLEPQLRNRIRREMELQSREEIRREIESQLRDEMYREMEPQLRAQIRYELEQQLNVQIRYELEPQLRDEMRREMEPQLSEQIRHEMEAQLREQIRRDVWPIRRNIENEIRAADEHIAWIDFRLHNLDEHEIDITLDAAIAICEICISPCMNRRPITLNCGHIFCGKCVREWCNENRVCPKCRTQILFSRSIFKAYPTLEAI